LDEKPRELRKNQILNVLNLFYLFFILLVIKKLNKIKPLSDDDEEEEDSPSGCPPANRVMMMPVCELTPTAVTNIFPLPSIAYVPEFLNIYFKYNFFSFARQKGTFGGTKNPKFYRFLSKTNFFSVYCKIFRKIKENHKYVMNLNKQNSEKK
jgi:hypothetical protein